MWRRFSLIALAAVLAATIALAEEARTGAWVDEIIITEEKSRAASVAKISAGKIHLAAQPGITDPVLYAKIVADPNIRYEISYGSYRDIRFNPVGPIFPGTGKLNPFSVPRIREAMNYLVDRDYIVKEILGGLGAPIYALAGTEFPESKVRYPHIIEAIEEAYAHNPEKAKAIITEEMHKLGAEMIGGVWHYKGEPVEIILLIRIDLSPFPAAGHYVADLLEGIGFKTVRDLKTSREAAPIWLFGDPADGKFHIYTGGWGIPVIPRDQASTFAGMQTSLWYTVPLWMAYDAQLKEWDPAYYDLIVKLFKREFRSMAEREELFKAAMWGWMKFANQVSLCDMASVTPGYHTVRVAQNRAYGPGDGWAQTIHFHKEGVPQAGGTLRIEMESVLIHPWNPVHGSNWVYDLFVVRDGLREAGLIQDPRDGLYWPKRIEWAEVYHKKGLPVEKTLDWLALTFVDKIQVPLDAWADWDAKNQRFITVAERFGPEGTTALTKSVVYYPLCIYNFPYHDGSKLSLADFLLAFILFLDRAKPESPVYDEARVGPVKTFLDMFRGFRIVSKDPLVIEYYTNAWSPDAEWNITTMFPGYAQGGSNPWHMIALGIIAEAERKLAFGSAKAKLLGVEWMDYTKGPSLEILKGSLEKAIETNYIPYAPTLGEYITPEEAAQRWANLKKWYEERGHFWVDMGPYYLYAVHPVEKIIELRRFAAHPDPAGKWLFFLED